MANRPNDFIEKDRNVFLQGRQMADLMRRVLDTMFSMKEIKIKTWYSALGYFKAFN